MSSKLSPMQQELLSRADQIFASIGSALKSGADLAVQGGKAVAEQLPDVAMQYVMYGRAINSTYIMFAVFCLFMAYYCVMRVGVHNVFKLKNPYEGAIHEVRVFSIFIAGLGFSAIGLFAFFANLKEFVLVWFAPKVWLILELVQLVKRVKG